MPWEIDVMTVLRVSFREVDESRLALLLYRFSFNIDFWFTTSTRRCNRQVNCCATEMLLAHNSIHSENSTAAARRSRVRHPRL